jgi:hypothetical protein
MPRDINSRAEVIMGAGGVPGSIEGSYYPFATYGGGAFCTDNDIIVALSPSAAIASWNRRDPPVQIPSQFPGAEYNTANAISGGGGRWICSSEWPDGTKDSVLFSNAFTPPRRYAGFGDVAADGTIAYKTIYQSDRGITIIRPDGSETNGTELDCNGQPLSQSVPIDLRALPGGKAYWRGGAYGRLALQPYFRDAMNLVLITIAGEEWLVYWSNALPGLVAQPDGASEGYILEQEGKGYNHVGLGGSEYGTVAWSYTAGEGPGDIVKLQISRAGVKIIKDVYDPPRPAPQWQSFELPLVYVGRPVWLGWFEFDQISRGPGNASLLVRNIHGQQYDPIVVTDESLPNVTGDIIAKFISGGSVEGIEKAAAESWIRPMAYWDQRHWPRWPKLPADSWLGIQAYCRADESPGAFQADMTRVLSSAPAQPLCLVCQQYTSNASLTKDLAGIIPVFLRLARDFKNVVALMVFSGYGRATGLIDHQELLTTWEDIAAHTETPPIPPNPRPPDPEPPKPEPPEPEPPKVFAPAKPMKGGMMETRKGALRVGEFFGRIEGRPSPKYGVFLMTFSAENSQTDPNCQFDFSQPDGKNWRVQFDNLPAGHSGLLEADATLYSESFCQQFYVKPGEDWSGYAVWQGWQLGPSIDDVNIIVVHYDRDGERYVSASLNVVWL